MNSEEAMSMFRFSVISPLLVGDDERSLKKRMYEQASKIWTLPDGRSRQFSWGTIEDWLYKYRNFGLKGLTNDSRCDNGKFRQLNDQTSEFIDNYVKEHSRIKTSIMIAQMKNDVQFFDQQLPSDSTIYRYVRTIRPCENTLQKERRAFEAPYSGSLWQTDVMYGPYLPRLNDRGKWVKNQTFLIALIDDHSRLLCHGEFYFKQDLLSYLSCLKQGLYKYGIPERLYCDNGQIFLSEQIKRIMAGLGTSVIHCPIADGASKGKVERFFLTVRNSFLNPLIEFEKPKKLDELNSKFRIWCHDSYNMKEHSTTGITPMNRWMTTSHKVRLMNSSTDSGIFRFKETRRVKKDGTISFKNKIYETTSVLAGKTVTLSYDPFLPEQPYVSFENQDFGKAHLLNRDFNNRISRKITGKVDIK